LSEIGGYLDRFKAVSPRPGVLTEDTSPFDLINSILDKHKSGREEPGTLLERAKHGNPG
jgi:hypothetical protein